MESGEKCGPWLKCCQDFMECISHLLSISEVPNWCWGSWVSPCSAKEQCFLSVSLYVWFPTSYKRESAAISLTLLLLSSHEKHSHLLPESLVSAKSPNGLISSSRQKQYISIVENAEGVGVVLWQREEIKAWFLLAKCVVQLKGMCNHLGDQVYFASWLPGLFFIIWMPDKIQMFWARNTAPDYFPLGLHCCVNAWMADKLVFSILVQL